LLDSAQEQCRQILIRWNEAFSEDKSEAQQEPIIYTALGQFLTIFIQRATIARLREQDSKALKERIFAAYLCQHILDALVQPNSSLKSVQEFLALKPEPFMSNSPSLPRLPELSLETTTFHPRFLGLVEVYCAAGEVAEELGHAAVSSDFRHHCYKQAERCFHMAITFAHTIVSAHKHDPGYMLRHYQRYASLLEERLAASPEDRKETSITMAALLKENFSHATVMNT
jgi:hypothetical protein